MELSTQNLINWDLRFLDEILYDTFESYENVTAVYYPRHNGPQPRYK